MSFAGSILPFLSYVCSETHIFSGGGDFACIYQARGSGRIFVVFGCPEVGLDWCFWLLNWIGYDCGGSNYIYLEVSEVRIGIVIVTCLEVWIHLMS